MKTNCSIYFFGVLGDKNYSQYPDDYTISIFKDFSAKAKANTQIIIHREQSLMYYGYVYKLKPAGHYLGICLLFNDLVIIRPTQLFPIFEDFLSNIVSRGEIIRFLNNGDIISSAQSLTDKTDEINRLTTSLQDAVGHIESGWGRLPAVDYSIEANEEKVFSLSDDEKEIYKASYTYPYTTILKDSYFDSVSTNSYRGILKGLNNEKKRIEGDLSELQKQYEKLERQKKQLSIVAILGVILLVVGIALYAISDTLKTTQNHLKTEIQRGNELEQTLWYKNDSLQIARNNLQKANNRITSLSFQLDDAHNQIEEMESFETNVSESTPFIVKGTSMNWYNGRLTVNYYGTQKVSRSYKITINAFAEDLSYSYSNYEYINIHPGNNSFTIYVNNRMSNSKWHSFIIRCNNQAVGSARH